MWVCEDVSARERKRRCEVRRCEDEQMWRWADVKMRRCEDEKMWRWEDVKMSTCEDEKMWRSEDVKMRRCEDEKMWRWEDVKWEDVKWEGVKWEDVKMRRCEDEKVWRWEDVKMRGCEDEKMWRWEDEIQTPTIGRTLRSDALGKKANFWYNYPLYIYIIDKYVGVCMYIYIYPKYNPLIKQLSLGTELGFSTVREWYHPPLGLGLYCIHILA